MEIKTEFLIGKQKGSEWSGVYGYRPEEVIDPTELFAVMRISSSLEDLGLERVAKLLLDEFQSVFYEESKEKDAIVRLEDAVWKMKSRMDMILSREDKLAESGIDFEMGLVVIEKMFMYAGIIGESKIYIERNGSFVDITKGLIDANMMGFLKTGSLQLEPFDKIALSTSKLSNVAEADIQNAMTDLDITQLSRYENDYGAAFLMFGDVKLPWKELNQKVEQKQEELPELEAPQTEEQIDQEMHEVVAESPVAPEAGEEIPEVDAVISEEQPEANQEEVPQEDVNAVPAAPNKFVESFKNRFSSLKQNIGPKISALKEKSASRFNKNINKVEASDVLEGDSESDTIEPRSKTLTELSSEEVGIEEEKSTAEAAGFVGKLKSILAKIVELVKKLAAGVRNYFKHNNRTYAKFVRDVATKINNVFQAIWRWFKKEIIGTGDRRDLYLKANRRKRNRIILGVGVVIVAIVLFIAINNRNNAIKEQERIDKIHADITSIKSQLDNLVSQVPAAKAGDDTRKTSIISSFDSLTQSIESEKVNGIQLADLNQYEETIQKNKDAVLSITPVTEPQIIADVGKLYPEANLTDVVYSSGNLYVSDLGRNVVYQLGTTIDSQPTQFATGLNQPYLLVKDANDDIIFYDNDATSQIGKISIKENGKVTRFDGLSSAVIGKVDAAAIYDGNDALYEIHENHQQIFKREQNGDNYNPGGAVYQTDNPPNWRTDPTLNNAIDISVPYEVYVLIKGKGLQRYLAGGDNSLAFNAFSNLTQNDFNSLNNATCFAIDGHDLVVGDPQNQRVLLFTIQDDDNKTVHFEKQYVYRGSDNIFKSIKKIAVNEANKSIYVMDGLKIIRLDVI